MRILPLLAICLALGGCLATPVGKSGGMGSVTVPNTNRLAIVDAAQDIFPDYGYTTGPASFPESISFDKPAGTAGQIAYGSYDDPATMRVRLTLSPIPGTNDVRVSPTVFSVSDANEAGFDDPTRRSQLFALEFKPILNRIKAQAADAGPM